MASDQAFFTLKGEDRPPSARAREAMALVASTPSARLRLGAPPRWLSSALVLAGCAGFMFFDLKTAPIVLWDESRIAVNALEMHLSGHLRLVTTYGFQPDLWNTKPPLLIWLMDLSASLFGVSEWSLRLPSMIAAMGTLALVMSFTRRVTHSFLAGTLAAVLLTLSLLFFAEHGARTADYEALLCLLTTAYLYILFFALHRREPPVLLVMTAGALIGLAILTKSVAGLLPGVGVVLYLVVTDRWRRPLQSPSYMAAAALGLGLAAGYFILREQAAPGYIKAVLVNDMSGRFAAALEGHAGPPWYYLQDLFVDASFSAGLLAAAAPLALLRARGTARLGLIYGLCVTGGIVAVLSASATKLNHYAISACPFMAIYTAISLHEGLKALERGRAAGKLSPLMLRTLHVSCIGALCLIAVRSGYARYGWLSTHEFYPQALYGELFDELHASRLTSVQVVESGAMPSREPPEVPQDYAPQLDFYRLLANSRGMEVVRIAPAALSARGDVVLATCDPDYAPRLKAMGVNLAATPGCVAVRR